MESRYLMIWLPIIVAVGIFLISIARSSKIKRKTIYEIEATIRANKQKFKKELKLVGKGDVKTLEQSLEERGYDAMTRKLVVKALLNIYKRDHGMK